GGGIAGVTVAKTLRQQAPEDEVVLFNAETEPLYSRMLLKEYAKGAAAESAVRIHDDDWFEARGIKLRAGERVERATGSAVETNAGTKVEYDNLFVTAGGSQVNPFDVDAENVSGMWTLDETRHIREQAASGDMGTAVVIGAGFLGLELADALAVQGVETHYVMRGYWSRHGMGRDGAAIVHRALEDHGIHVEDEQAVEEFVVEDGRATAVRTTDQTLDCDWVGLAVGLRPNVDYLQETAVELDHGVVTDEHMQTAEPNIYAAGDIARYYDVHLDRFHSNGTWLSAIEQARVAARHALGQDVRFDFVEGHSVAIRGLDAPVVFLADWDGDHEAIDRLYGDSRYRRLVFENDRLVGASLVGESGDVVGQLKQLIRDGPAIADDVKERLLEPRLNREAIAPPVG
ncbi:MAG: NAD(P)/FAD-dependent oxidoreductase, partial [Halobacteriales archaeon]